MKDLKSCIGREHKKTISDESFLRLACEEDSHDIWLWRNSPEVRKWSFNPETIPYSRHQEWFKCKLQDKKGKIYICTNNAGDKIGQIRFETRRNAAYLNINLNPEYIGKRFGSRIIGQGTSLLFKEYSGVAEVIAEVLEENIASRKAFEKNGYTFSHNIVKAKKRVGIFKKVRDQK